MAESLRMDWFLSVPKTNNGFCLTYAPTMPKQYPRPALPIQEWCIAQAVVSSIRG